MPQKAFDCPNPKLEGRRFSAVRDCSFKTFAETPPWTHAAPYMRKMTRQCIVVIHQSHYRPEGSRMLRFPDYVTAGQDSGKVVSLTHRPPVPQGNAPGTHIC